jgi:hypothetical protein
VLRHFAPYDRSVYSVHRLDAALSVLFGKQRPREPSTAIVQLIGAYVGESWKQAFGGDWYGRASTLAAVSVNGSGVSVRPFQRVIERLRDGAPLALVQPEHLHPGADPLGNSVPLSLAPPAPWDPDPWPSRALFEELGDVLPFSVIGVYCAEVAGLPLDHSRRGSEGLERYLDLVAPANASHDTNSAWARRVALLVGAYVGQVLVKEGSAHWEASAQAPSANQYRLTLPDGSSVSPVLRVLDRIAGRRPSATAFDSVEP